MIELSAYLGVEATASIVIHLNFLFRKADKFLLFGLLFFKLIDVELDRLPLGPFFERDGLLENGDILIELTPFFR